MPCFPFWKKKLEKKQQPRQEELRADLRLLGLEQTGSRPDPPNASEALRSLIQPLTDLLEPGRRSVRGYQNALDIGRESWNLQVKYDGSNDFEEALDESSRSFASEDVPATDARKVLQLFIDRKRALFPHDDRVVVDAQAIEGEDRIHFKVIWARFAKVH